MLLDPHISEKVGYADNQKRMYSSLQIKGSGQLGIYDRYHQQKAESGRWRYSLSRWNTLLFL